MVVNLRINYMLIPNERNTDIRGDKERNSKVGLDVSESYDKDGIVDRIKKDIGRFNVFNIRVIYF